jgi:phosphatidylethanolamine/phosphatidyl-N-methylethanolamine N-methyltransferase
MQSDNNKHTRSRYNLLAPIYDLLEFLPERLYYAKWRKNLWARVGGNEVIEIGIGTGKNIAYYPKGVTVKGIDISKNMLSKAERFLRKNTDSQVVLELMDIQQMDY